MAVHCANRNNVWSREVIVRDGGVHDIAAAETQYQWSREVIVRDGSVHDIAAAETKYQCGAEKLLCVMVVCMI